MNFRSALILEDALQNHKTLGKCFKKLTTRAPAFYAQELIFLLHTSHYKRKCCLPVTLRQLKHLHLADNPLGPRGLRQGNPAGADSNPADELELTK